MDIKDSAKTIVCYGDSNTWGRIPAGERYPRSVRWTGVLQNLLGGEYEVRNEGLSARTLVVLDPKNPERTGITHLKSILLTNRPIEAVVVMLGTNDIKNRFSLSAQDIAGHLEETINLIKEQNVTKILIVAPIQVVVPANGLLKPDFVDRLEMPKQISELFRNVAEKHNCGFLNSQDFITCSPIDGLHLEADMHKKFAEIIKVEILKMF